MRLWIAPYKCHLCRRWLYLHSLFHSYLYLPPMAVSGLSEGWNSELIRLSIMWLNSLKTTNSAVFPSVQGHSTLVQLSFKTDPFITLRKLM